MLYKTSLCRSSSGTFRAIGGHKTNYACIVEADESMRIPMEGTPRRYHEDHVAGRGMNSLNSFNLMHKFMPMPMPQAMKKYQMQRQQWKNNGEYSRKYWNCNWRKSETKKEVMDEVRNEGRNDHFASLMDLCHLKNSELEPQCQKYKGRVVLRGDIVRDDSGSHAVFTEQGSSASQMTAAFPHLIRAVRPSALSSMMTAKVSWRSHRCKSNKFTESSLFDAQLYSNASSIKHTGCKGCSGKE